MLSRQDVPTNVRQAASFHGDPETAPSLTLEFCG